MTADLVTDTDRVQQTELGLLPAAWSVVKLGDHAAFKTGPFGSTLHKSDYVDDGIPVINPMQIVNGKLVPTSTMAISEAAAQKLSEFRLRTGNVVIGRRGDMGRCAVVNAHADGWLCGTGSVAIRLRPSLHSGFLQRQLASSLIVNEIENTSVGTTMINLNQGTLSNLSIPLPPTLAEQEAIAEALGDADAWIESLEQLVAKKRHLKKAAMQQLLTGKKRLPGFEGEWDTRPIGDLFNISGGLSASRDQLSHDGLCYLHYGDIHGSTRNFIDVDREYQTIPKLDVPLNKVSPSSLLSDGDVVFVDASEDVDGTNRHVVIANPRNTPFISGLHTIVTKPKTNDLEPLYCRYCFETENVKQQFRFFAVGTKVSGVSKSNIAKIEVAVPSPTEQRAIADVLIDMDTEIEAIEAKLAKARQIKQGMMQELLTGRIRLV